MFGSNDMFSSNKAEPVNPMSNDSLLISYIDGLINSTIPKIKKLNFLDSLISKNDITSPYARMHLYHSRASLKAKTNISGAREDLDKALVIANKYFNPKERTKIKNNLGILHARKQQYLLALQVFHEVAQEHKSSGDMVLWAESSMNEATVQKNLGNFSKAILLALESAEVLDTSGHLKTLAKAYNTIGNSYKGLEQYAKALEYHRKSLQIRKKYGTKYARSLASSYNNIGNAFRYLKKWDSASYYYKQYLNLGKEHHDTSIIARAFDNLGQLCYEQSKMDSALYFTTKSIKLREKIQDKEGLITSLSRQAKLYVKEDQNQMAVVKLERAIYISSSLGLKKERLKAYNILRGIYRKEQNHLKYSFYTEKYIELHDSIFKEKHLEEVTKMEAIFQVSKSKREVQLEIEKNRIQRDLNQKQKQQIWYLFSILFLVFGLLVTLVVLFRKTRKSKKIVDHLIKELKHRTTGNFQTILSVINLKKKEVNNLPLKMLDDLQLRVQSLGTLHSLLNNNDKGLVNMNKYITDVLNHLAIAFDINQQQAINLSIEQIQLPVSKAVILATIIAEISTNTFKYAFPNNAFPEFHLSFTSLNKGQYNLEVRDNGKGGVIKSKGTLGIDIINQLSEDLDGVLKEDDSNGVWYKLSFYC